MSKPMDVIIAELTDDVHAASGAIKAYGIRCDLLTAERDMARKQRARLVELVGEQQSALERIKTSARIGPQLCTEKAIHEAFSEILVIAERASRVGE